MEGTVRVSEKYFIIDSCKMLKIILIKMRLHWNNEASCKNCINSMQHLNTNMFYGFLSIWRKMKNFENLMTSEEILGLDRIQECDRTFFRKLKPDFKNIIENIKCWVNLEFNMSLNLRFFIVILARDLAFSRNLQICFK